MEVFRKPCAWVLTGISCFMFLYHAPAAGRSLNQPQESGNGRIYIIILDGPPLAEQVAVTGSHKIRIQTMTGQPTRPDLKSDAARKRLGQMEKQLSDFQVRAQAVVGRTLPPVHRYSYALNGLSVKLTESEAKQLAALPGVARIQPDDYRRLHTDAGAKWIGAASIWNGEDDLPQSKGEGVVVGIIDTGINWQHESFLDATPTPSKPYKFDHQNPYPAPLGLCSVPKAGCNDKLVGIYDFIPEDEAKGRDWVDHGSMTASIAAGNELHGMQIPLGLEDISSISGVAPHANIISYRACTAGFCPDSALLKAIDQAIADQVDVINFSVGSPEISPWLDLEALALLNAYRMGIFVAASAGNGGPRAGSIESPANAPWVLAAGAASHDRRRASRLSGFQGGNGAPPGDIFGAPVRALPRLESGIVSQKRIVYAGDYGNALCGKGPPVGDGDYDRGDQAFCEQTTSPSNPFPKGTFHGEIVVCDHGTYGRVEKGLNLSLAGAGGYVLANTAAYVAAYDDYIHEDVQCLPAAHINRQDGDRLRAWLAAGAGHQATLNASELSYTDAVADQLGDFSSRGPGTYADTLKPDLVAPGVDILGASSENNWYLIDQGTSYASPFIAGAAALLKSLDPGYTPEMIRSMLATTATAELIKDEKGLPANPNQRGAGRPRLGDAAHAGLYFPETPENYEAADPARGGDPRTLNLPSLVDSHCLETCEFTRRVAALAGEHTWSVEAAGFPQGTLVTVTPQQFELPEDGMQEINIRFDISHTSKLHQWLYGDVNLMPDDGLAPVSNLPVALYAFAGDLPASWSINTESGSGWQDFHLDKLVSMGQASFQAGGLVEPLLSVENLVEDPTNAYLFDTAEGIMTVIVDVPEGALLLHSETLASVAADLDLFVGRDLNGDGHADNSEKICESTTPEDLERCDIAMPASGAWWVVVQNWSDGDDSGNPAQEVRLLTAVVDGEISSEISATGPGIVGTGEGFDVRLAWEDVDALSGQTLFGAVAIGSSRELSGDIGVIPVEFTRTGMEKNRTVALIGGQMRALTAEAGSSFDRLFIDVPQGTTELEVRVTADTANALASVEASFGRLPFDRAFDNAPFVASLANLQKQSPSPVAMANPSMAIGAEGLILKLSGNELSPGRFLVSLKNNGAQPAAIGIVASLKNDGTSVALHGGLWESASRPDIKQGLEYNFSGNYGVVVWYTYDQDGQPLWYLANEKRTTGNVWTADLQRFTNDGHVQQFTTVGKISITTIGPGDAVFSWSLFGESGSDRIVPISSYGCPKVNGIPESYTGLWFSGIDGLGGTSILVNAYSQAMTLFIYDSKGIPRWLLASGGGSALASDLELLQFKGYCPLCTGTVSHESVGLISRTFNTATTGSWTLDYLLKGGLTANVQRSESVVKITDTLPCD